MRPGARYACFGDGLCCTDAHLVGPLSSRDAARVRAFRPGAVARHRRLDVLIVRDVGGRCALLDDGCALHRARGERDKPRACREFPLGVVGTPLGVRVTTQHRCPCRTLGERPPLTSEIAARSLSDAAGRVRVDARVDRVRLDDARPAPFARYVARERPLLDALASGAPPERALGARALPPLGDIGWADVGHHLRGMFDGTSCGAALAWMGGALIALSGGRAPRPPARAWAPSFDAAARRSPRARPVDELLADFAADVVWGLEWAPHASLDAALSDVATRVAAARWLVDEFVSRGCRADRAAAEAVMIVELGAATPSWPSVLAAMDAGARRSRGARHLRSSRPR